MDPWQNFFEVRPHYQRGLAVFLFFMVFVAFGTQSWIPIIIAAGVVGLVYYKLRQGAAYARSALSMSYDDRQERLQNCAGCRTANMNTEKVAAAIDCADCGTTWLPHGNHPNLFPHGR